MDERDLQELFRDAPGEAPPPSFDVSDVAAASRRATARQRMRLTAAGAAAALVLAGGGLFAALGPLATEGGHGGSAGDSLSAEEGQNQGQPFPGDARLDSGAPLSTDTVPPKQGGGDEQLSEAEGAARTARCAKVDRQLATALAGELPVDPGADPVRGDLPCGSRNAAFQLKGGTVSAVVFPHGGQPRFAPPAGTELVEARGPGGDLVMVLSAPKGDGRPPLSGELQKIADTLAAQT